MHLHNRINIEWNYLRRVVYITDKLKLILLIGGFCPCFFGAWMVQDEDNDWFDRFCGGMFIVCGLFIIFIALFYPVEV